MNKKRACMEGTGMNMLVSEGNYNASTQKFDNNKGLLFKLSASEIQANKDTSAVADDEVRGVIEGQGLFRHKNAARKTAKAVKNVIDALEGEMEGKGLIKSV